MRYACVASAVNIQILSDYDIPWLEIPAGRFVMKRALLLFPLPQAPDGPVNASVLSRHASRRPFRRTLHSHGSTVRSTASAPRTSGRSSASRYAFVLRNTPFRFDCPGDIASALSLSGGGSGSSRRNCLLPAKLCPEFWWTITPILCLFPPPLFSTKSVVLLRIPAWDGRDRHQLQPRLRRRFHRDLRRCQRYQRVRVHRTPDVRGQLRRLLHGQQQQPCHGLSEQQYLDDQRGKRSFRSMC